MAATAKVIRLCACLRHWPYRARGVGRWASVGNCGADFQLVCFEQTLAVTIFREHGIMAHIP